ncbi:MAG: 6,7-dimethyl-8-ribityllumazine synthase [Burkholderiales bacterium]
MADKSPRIGIVVSRFNNEVTDVMLPTCVEALKKHGVAEKDIRIVSVPGALEAALVLQKLAQSGKFDALIALGAVIRGETYHFEVVANESAAALMNVQLDTGVPVANGILTTDTDEQAIARAKEKANAVAAIALEMAQLLRRLDED